MWGLLANVAAQGYGLWQKKKAMDEAVGDYNRKVQVNKQLAAEQLAITYNSIATAQMVTNREAYRQEAEIREKAATAAGNLEAQAASLGVSGRRAELARKQAVSIQEERAIASLDADRQQAQDDLIARAEVEERQTVNRLISSMPDVPGTDLSSDILDFVGGVKDSFSQHKQDSQDRQDAIVKGARETQGAISSTGINQFGVQAKL